MFGNVGSLPQIDRADHGERFDVVEAHPIALCLRRLLPGLAIP
jgi:hypothetical protein